MDMNSRKIAVIHVVLVVFASGYGEGEAQETPTTTTLVPAVITFGDSVVDVGNNVNLNTLFKADYLPYGKDFGNHKPNGRFCNGKLATDVTAETLGFKNSAHPYLSPRASGKNLLRGVNFASAASGYDDNTAILHHAIPLSQQLNYYKEYQRKLARVVGSNKSASIINEALYLLATGSGDFLHNYYINPKLNKTTFTPDKYSSYLVAAFESFIKDLYGLGARRIGVVSLPPLGCLPATRTLFSSHDHNIINGGCVSSINHDAQTFNNKLNSSALFLQKQLLGLKIVVFDIFKPLYDLVQSPSKFGFVEASKGCCGRGSERIRVFLCNPKSSRTCSNATQYVFWDGVHPSEAANKILADSMLLQGISLVT
ncbi:GDSL esterase/lipase APG [Arachis ipaensis]|uniref:GDSL esterase/lipase APG n=1 Tax=Arachis ipaensis TaxID=130454 RepID=UPI0007AF22B1|nr:GDSL esterase/lipase APG [Arachis ipaensis]XP_025679962.1 GDSL esterase/lipase APG [Arachis hypogaea]